MKHEWKERIDAARTKYLSRQENLIRGGTTGLQDGKTEMKRVRRLAECRRQGVWDDPELMEWGYLDVDEEKDIREMINESLLTSEQKRDLILEFIKGSHNV